MDALAPILRPPRAAPRRLLRLRSDGSLGERFAAGDEGAFAVLYERHRPSVLAVCIAVLGSRHDAEDAAQEAFAALAVQLRTRPPRELRAWLVRVARNAAIDLSRRRRVKPLAGELEAEAGSAGSGISAELDSVLAGIRLLPESQRTALLMRELAGHSYQEIATMLHTDEEGVRGLIARARTGLRGYREASELPCATVRAALAEEQDGRRREKTVRRHVRGCPSCQAYREALRSDARALRALVPTPAAGVAGGGAAVGLAAKGALAGGALSQVGAVCAVSVCSVGGFVLLHPHGIAGHPAHSRARASAVRRHTPARHARHAGGGGESAAASSELTGSTAPLSAGPAAAVRSVAGGSTHGATVSTLTFSPRAPGGARSRTDGGGGAGSSGSSGDAGASGGQGAAGHAADVHSSAGQGSGDGSATDGTGGFGRGTTGAWSGDGTGSSRGGSAGGSGSGSGHGGQADATPGAGAAPGTDGSGGVRQSGGGGDASASPGGGGWSGGSGATTGSADAGSQSGTAGASAGTGSGGDAGTGAASGSGSGSGLGSPGSGTGN